MTAVSGQSARQSASIDYMHAVLCTPSQWCSQHPLTKCEQCSALTVSGAVSGHCSEPVSAAKTGAVAVKSQLQCCSLVTCDCLALSQHGVDLHHLACNSTEQPALGCDGVCLLLLGMEQVLHAGVAGSCRRGGVSHLVGDTVLLKPLNQRPDALAPFLIRGSGVLLRDSRLSV